MDLINSTTAQLRDLFQSMTPGARITSGLLLAVVLVSLTFLFRSGSAGPDEFLFGGESFSNAQIARMEVALAEGKITGWDTKGNRIRVQRNQKEAALAAIGSAGAIPKDTAMFMDEALNGGGIFESREKQATRNQAARENQLSHMVSLMPWVESARVILDVEPGRGVNRKNRATASVMLVPKPGETLDQRKIKNLKDFIAFSDANLTPENVHVTNGGDSFESDIDVVFDDPYLKAKHEIERSYRKRLLDGLSYIPGVQVMVSGQIDNTASRTRLETTPEGAETLRERSENEMTESTLADGGGQPGQLQNSASANGQANLARRENQARTERDSIETQNVIGTVQEQSHQTGFVPKEMYASIGIPSEYVERTWRADHPDAEPDDFNATQRQAQEDQIRTRVEKYVQNILPRLSAGRNDYSQVTVIFTDSLPTDPVAPPSLAENALAWAGNYWPTLSMLGLAVFSLLMLRSVVKPAPLVDRRGQGPVLQLETEGEAANSEDEEEDEENRRPRLRLRRGDTLKDDLSEMVRENPDAAAAILRSWISNAS